MQAPAGAEETKRARAPLGVWLECGLALLFVCLLSVAAGCGGGQDGGVAEPAKVPAASTPSSSGAALVWHDKSALREKYGVLNLPAVRIVSVGGQVVAEIDELIEAEQFLDLLREARSS